MLQARFAIISRPARFWKEQDLHVVMKACIILNNMIVEDERDEDLPLDDYDVTFTYNENDIESNPDPASFGRYADFIERFFEIRDGQVHQRLQLDLIQHHWQRNGLV